MDVGICELRDGLSRHLASVREEHTITVTDHGRPVARLVPADVPTTLERLIQQGKVTHATRSKGSRPAPVAGAGTASGLVGEQRR